MLKQVKIVVLRGIMLDFDCKHPFFDGNIERDWNYKFCRHHLEEADASVLLFSRLLFTCFSIDFW